MGKITESLEASLSLKVALVRGRIRGTAGRIYSAVQRAQKDVCYRDDEFDRHVCLAEELLGNYCGSHKEDFLILLEAVKKDRRTRSMLFAPGFDWKSLKGRKQHCVVRRDVMAPCSVTSRIEVENKSSAVARRITG